MDYTELAGKFLQNMALLRKSGPQKNITEAMHGETFVLSFIYQQKGDVVPGEISDFMDISSARIAATLNSLENKGMITRQIDTADRRRIIVGLTQAGEDTAKQHQQVVMDDAAELLSLLGEHDAKEYVRITCKLAEFASKRRES